MRRRVLGLENLAVFNDAQRDRIKVRGDPPRPSEIASRTRSSAKATEGRKHNGDKRLQTIKSGGLVNSFRRGEWEHQIRGDVPNLRKAQDTALAPLLTKKLKRTLKPIFETRIHRTSVPVRRNRSRIEVVLDEGQVRAGRQSAPIGELELELKRGKASDLFKLAREMVRLVPATLALKSKSKRGYDLLENKTAEVVRAETIRLQNGMTTADAFRAISRSTLRQISGNAAAVARSDSEGVHQMRVGLRRLRAAISLFSKFLGDKQTERIKTELKWLTGELAPARDLDVYMRSKIKPLRRAAGAKRGMKELAAALASRRQAAFGRAEAAVASEEAKNLAKRSQDVWEREILLRVATQWQLLAAHREVKESKRQAISSDRFKSEFAPAIRCEIGIVDLYNFAVAEPKMSPRNKWAPAKSTPPVAQFPRSARLAPTAVLVLPY